MEDEEEEECRDDASLEALRPVTAKATKEYEAGTVD